MVHLHNPAAVHATRLGSLSDLSNIATMPINQALTVGLADGAGDNVWRRTVRAELEDEMSHAKFLEPLVYRDAHGDSSRAVRDVYNLAAHVDVLLVYADSGTALLPAIQDTTKRGVQVVVFGGMVGGTPGVDYLAQVNVGSGQTVLRHGERYGRWIAELQEDGAVLHLGGAEGNAYSDLINKGIRRGAPDRLVTEPVTTDWSPHQASEAIRDVIESDVRVAGVISEDSSVALVALRALMDRGRPLVPCATQDMNGLARLWYEAGPHHPRFHLMTTSSRTWISRVALRRGIAGRLQIDWPEPTEFDFPEFENTVLGMAPRHDPALPDSAIMSSWLQPEQLRQVVSGTE